MWLSGFKQQIVFQLAGRRTNPFEMAKPLPSPLAEGEPTGSQTTQQLRTQLVFIGRGVQAHHKEICEKLTACQVRISASVDAVCGGHRCCASYETAANGAKFGPVVAVAQLMGRVTGPRPSHVTGVPSYTPVAPTQRL